MTAPAFPSRLSPLPSRLVLRHEVYARLSPRCRGAFPLRVWQDRQHWLILLQPRGLAPHGVIQVLFCILAPAKLFTNTAHSRCPAQAKAIVWPATLHPRPSAGVMRLPGPLWRGDRGIYRPARLAATCSLTTHVIAVEIPSSNVRPYRTFKLVCKAENSKARPNSRPLKNWNEL